ncbi:hypothetical protein AVEN_263100-1 [Araneus ventricosus]|uniref:Uncharacterized protein n=1 Tax=Araneus ventricosus TaxID=182803 RepID=A0A4Y2CBW5_ARAVE|nr:hypothetical protein AVEN_263100-1 [Araneus ventricosus]
MHGGSSVESGFEPDHSRSKSRDLTTGPPRPRLHDTKQHNMFSNGFRDYHFWMILHWKGVRLMNVFPEFFVRSRSVKCKHPFPSSLSPILMKITPPGACAKALRVSESFGVQ